MIMSCCKLFRNVVTIESNYLKLEVVLEWGACDDERREEKADCAEQVEAK